MKAWVTGARRYMGTVFESFRIKRGPVKGVTTVEFKGKKMPPVLVLNREARECAAALPYEYLGREARTMAAIGAKMKKRGKITTVTDVMRVTRQGQRARLRTSNTPQQVRRLMREAEIKEAGIGGALRRLRNARKSV